MKGVILAAGKGTRLYPMTLAVAKPLLPVYDKPMIFYPLSVLLNAGIKDILIITPPNGTKPFSDLLGDGTKFGINLSYKEQSVQRGIADALIISEDFIGDDDIFLVLGDNICFSNNPTENTLKGIIKEAIETLSSATVFGYYVDDPRPFGVIEFDENGKAISIEEKPENPKSNYIIPGYYLYKNIAVKYAKELTSSNRGELEITDLNRRFLREGALCAKKLPADVIWYDVGSPENLLKASIAVKNQQDISGKKIAMIFEK